MKKFFDVFQNLKLKDDIKALFEDVTVIKITTNRDHTKMRVYIESSRLIEKSAIYDVKKAIEKSLMTGKHMEVQIIEKYNLSSQYTREYLLDEYKESLSLEFNEISHSFGVTFKKAPMHFNDNVLEISFIKNIVSESQVSEMKERLMSIFAERFGMPIEVEVFLKESEGKRFEEHNKKKIENEVQAIMKKSQKETEKKETETDEDGNEIVVKKVTKASAEDRDGVVYGKDFDLEDANNKRIISDLKDVYEGTGRVICKGQIFGIDSNETRTGKFIVKMDITDFTDSITVKIFLPNEAVKDDFLSIVKKGTFIQVLGSALYDDFDGEVEITRVGGIKVIPSFAKSVREDNAVEKRVELHCHTKMSDMDAVTDPGDLVQRAYDWGHKAIAITDHGVVLGFPDAHHQFESIKAKCKKNNEECDFKVIYGVEAYLVDDIKGMIVNSKGQTFDSEFVVFDLETTGFSAAQDKIIEIGAVKIKDGEIVDRFSTFVNPERPIPFRIEDLTGINDVMVKDSPKIEEVLPKFMEFCKDSIMVAHNADFDMSFIEANCRRMDIPCEFTVIDTVGLSRFLVTGLARYKLDTVAKALGVPLGNHHRAVDDAECTARIFQKLISRMKEQGITNLDEANEKGIESDEFKSKLPSNHAIILVKNLVGLKNLYKLISISHIETFANKRPRIMKSDYLKLNEGLIIGSACEAGELYQAILHDKPAQEIARIADFYDYFEIQPIGNNEFMVRTGNSEIDDKKKFLVDSRKDLEEINKKIYKLGQKVGKMTVATCDVHFMDPEDELYRRIIQYGNGYSDADDQPPIYLRTTEEMLDEFEYLGSEVAEEVVITNTNKIADMIETISPIHPDKCPPVLENSEENLRNMCYEKAHEMYGDKLPKIVEERLETELNSIIGNGYAVMYIMAQKLVTKSNEDGYLVGSRGSVGSSFAATMSSITECNPLAPHYYCEHCRTSVFENEYSASGDVDEEKIEELQGHIVEIRRNGGVGFDLPDGICPHCGEKMKKDGLEIPFETFLGFGGNKEPDIDLNFSGDYQARAHAYTEEMFGKGNTFRAGTISGVAEKTAFGYVKHYYEEHNEQKRKAEIERIKNRITGVRKTTGQHPGGIVIVPRDKEIYDFTPIQKPANDMNTDTITTHFEYHAIDSNLLKLDELGHDDPTMIRRLEKYTDTDVRKDVPFDDPKVMSLFESPKVLGITSNDIDGCPTGSLGLPELGTDFVIQMIVDTKPTKFADLVRLAGLSHGTNVWLGNAQLLIKDGRCTISSAICTRDDIMVYLMDKGIDPLLSFEIMEHVRKGKGLLNYYDKEGNEIDEEQIMRDNNVPDWYIWSCKKISYMFPKAHAAAYIMMALRVAWYKVYHPLAYYAAFFGIRAKQFNYETMCMGPQKLEMEYNEVKNRINNHTSLPKDDATYSDMRVVQEMYARGFEFMPLDIYKAKAHDFQIFDGKIMPSLDSIEGMGDKAAEQLEEVISQMDGPFESKKEMIEKCGINKTVMETMTKLGLLDGMKEDSQLSIFDL